MTSSSRNTYRQGRLHNIIGPRAKHCTGTHAYTTTLMNKTVNADKIKRIFIVLLVHQQNQCLDIKKHAVHTQISMGSLCSWGLGRLPSVFMRLDGTAYRDELRYPAQVQGPLDPKIKICFDCHVVIKELQKRFMHPSYV